MARSQQLLYGFPSVLQGIIMGDCLLLTVEQRKQRMPCYVVPLLKAGPLCCAVVLLRCVSGAC